MEEKSWMLCYCGDRGGMERQPKEGRFWRRKRVTDVPEVTGEHPGSEVPGVIFVDKNSTLRGLRQRAKDFLDSKPEIMKGAKKKKQQVVAFASSHGTGIMVGLGVIAAAGIGAEIFRRTRKRRKK